MPTQDEDLQAICHDIASRQRYRAGPKRMGDVVNELMTRRRLRQLQSSAQCSDAWRAAAGSALASHTVAGNIRRGVLEVFARNSAVGSGTDIPQEAVDRAADPTNSRLENPGPALSRGPGGLRIVAVTLRVTTARTRFDCRFHGWITP